MLRPWVNIQIGGFRFNYCTSVELQTSWDTLTDTCTIQLPTKLRDRNRRLVDLSQNAFFSRGQIVQVQFGYFPQLITEFEGYISAIRPGSPITIECQDVTWLLKQKNLESKSWRKVTISELLTYVMEGTGVPFEVLSPTSNLGAFRINNDSVVNILDVLSLLRTQFGLLSYARGGTLYVGYASYPGGASTPVTHQFNFQGNIIEGSSLTFEDSSEINVVLQGESIDPANNKRTVRYATYDQSRNIVLSSSRPTGEQRSMKFIGLSQSELDGRLREALPQFDFTGYSGTFTTFGRPSVKHGDYAAMTDARFPERNGTYLIKSATKSFGMAGIRQSIELDRVIL